MREVWKPVRGFKGYYEVSNFGRVRSLTVSRNHGGYRPRVIKGKMMRLGNGRRAVTLFGDDGQVRKARVAVLVAEAFIPNPRKFPSVLHKDDICTNDKVSNLYWGTHQMNGKDAIVNGRTKRIHFIPQHLLDELAAIPYGTRECYGKFGEFVRKNNLDYTAAHRARRLRQNGRL